MDGSDWHLIHSPFFEGLSQQEIAGIHARSDLRRLPRGESIFIPTDPRDLVFLLASGHARVYHATITRKQVLLGIVGPGELLGEEALVVSGERQHFAESMDPSTVIAIPAGKVRELMRSHPDLCVRAAELIARRRIECERRLTSLLFRPVRDRLISLLLDLAEKYGEPTAEGIVIGLKLSHQDLAGAIGSTRETVSHVLGQMQAEGSVRVQHRQIMLLEPRRLATSLEPPAPEQDAP